MPGLLFPAPSCRVVFWEVSHADYKTANVRMTGKNGFCIWDEECKCIQGKLWRGISGFVPHKQCVNILVEITQW